MKQYEEKQYEGKEELSGNPLNNGAKGTEMEFSSEMVPTGNCLFLLNLSAECNLTNGYRYIKELLMQHHNLYLKVP